MAPHLPAQLVQFLAPFLPYLLKDLKLAGQEAAKKLGEKAGEGGFEQAKALWDKLRSKVEARPAALEAAQEAAAHPDDADALAALRAFAQWANIPLDVRGVEEQSLAPRWLDRREQATLLREAERAVNSAVTAPARLQAVRDYSIVLLLLNTGLRISELCALTLSDLELSDRKGKVIVRQGKGSKRREIPLNQTARQAIRGWLEVRPPTAEALFVGRRGEALTPSGVHRCLAALARRAGIEHLSPHTLRHTFTKNLVDSGVGLERVAALLGHANLNTTRVYVTPGQRDLERAVEGLG